MASITYAVLFSFFLTDLSFTELKNQRKQVSSVQHDSRASSRGIIPQAKIRTIKMTFVIILGKHMLMQFIYSTFNYHHTTNFNGAALFVSTSYNPNNKNDIWYYIRKAISNAIYKYYSWCISVRHHLFHVINTPFWNYCMTKTTSGWLFGIEIIIVLTTISYRVWNTLRRRNFIPLTFICFTNLIAYWNTNCICCVKWNKVKLFW